MLTSSACVQTASAIGCTIVISVSLHYSLNDKSNLETVLSISHSWEQRQGPQAWRAIRFNTNVAATYVLLLIALLCSSWLST